MLKEAGGIRRVVLKTGRTDLRRGIDGLKAVISLNGMDPLEKGTLFLFCGRRNDRIRGLTFDHKTAQRAEPLPMAQERRGHEEHHHGAVQEPDGGIYHRGEHTGAIKKLYFS